MRNDVLGPFSDKASDPTMITDMSAELLTQVSDPPSPDAPGL